MSMFRCCNCDETLDSDFVECLECSNCDNELICLPCHEENQEDE
jgi:hypothetical protein